MQSQAILPHLVGDTRNALPFIDRTYGTPLFCSESEVLGLAYAQDGTLWSIEESGVVRQWSRDGKMIDRNFLTDLETIWCFNCNATLLASASDDLVVWDVVDGTAILRVPAESWVMALAFSPDGTILASGHEDGKVRIWEVGTGKLISTIKAHPRAVSAVAFRTNDLHLATAGEDRLIQIWELGNLRNVETFAGHSDRIPCLSWQPGSDILISAGWDTTARVWKFGHPDPLILLNSHSDQVQAIAFSSEGNYLACADSDFDIHIWNNPLGGQHQHVLHGHSDEIRALAFSADSTRLASAGADRVVHVWDVPTGRLIAGPNPRARHSIALVDGSNLVSTAGNSIQTWEIESMLPSWSPEGEIVYSVAASPDGRLLATSGPSTEVKIWNTHDHSLQACLNHTKQPILNLTFSPNSTLLASASEKDGLVWVWRMGEAEAILVIPEAAESSRLESIVFHPHLNWLAVGGIDWLSTSGSDGDFCLWDLDQREKISSVPRAVTCMAFDPIGTYLAVGTLAQSVAIYRVSDMKLEYEFLGHQDRIGAVRYSPDGSWLVSAGDDCTVRVWNTLTHRLVVARQFDAAVQSIAFSHDGKYLYTGNGNTTCYRLELKKLLDD